MRPWAGPPSRRIHRLSGAEVTGPLTSGMDKPARGPRGRSDLNGILHLTAPGALRPLAVVEARQR